jgi:hypothetical protein
MLRLSSNFSVNGYLLGNRFTATIQPCTPADAHPASAQKKTSAMFFVVLREEIGKLRYGKNYAGSWIAQQPTRNSLIYSSMDYITGSTTQPTPPQHRQKDTPSSYRVRQKSDGTNSSSDDGRQSGEIFNTTTFNSNKSHQHYRTMVLGGQPKSSPLSGLTSMMNGKRGTSHFMGSIRRHDNKPA